MSPHPPIDESVILTRYDAGESITEIADVLGHSRDTVRRVLQSNAVYQLRIGKKQALNPSTRAWVALRRQGLSYREIARRYGDESRYQTIARHIKRAIREGM